MNFSFFFNWNSIKSNINNKKLILNFGPQHPAAHGVLRLILQLSNEVIEKADIHIGLLHRSTENLIQTKHYEKSIPYFDRLDYVSMMTQEHAYCLTIEKLLNIQNISKETNYIRVLFDELTRVLNHMLAIACHALDIGSMSSIFWSFEERENIMEFYERVSGARMHAAFHKVSSNFYYTLDKNLLLDILKFIKNCYKTLNEMHNVLTYSKIWKQRLINIGTMNINNIKNWNLTGVMARSVGFKKDIRLSKKHSYSNYNNIFFKSFIGINGDSYDRYLIRMFEMAESLHISNTIVEKLLNNNNNNSVIYQQLTNKQWSFDLKNYTYMEDLIEHFIQWHTGITIKSGINCNYIESPKGEFGVILVSNNTNKPLKCKIRSPSYFNLQFLPKLAKGHYLADLAALIGTIDIVFGEIDR
jgi:NADH:ubiquinone oxidoreductase subunit D